MSDRTYQIGCYKQPAPTLVICSCGWQWHTTDDSGIVAEAHMRAYHPDDHAHVRFYSETGVNYADAYTRIT